MSSKIKIALVTGTRAEYGLLRHLIKLFNKSNRFDLKLMVTGSHLSEQFGNTYLEIINDGISIDEKINLNLISDTASGLSKSLANGISGFADILEFHKPDLLLVLGDRYEILSAVICAMFARIPIAHLHGGELTEGAIDDSIRHAVTKFSHLHFVANEEYRNRVLQLGEAPDRVFTVGGLGVDAINSVGPLMNRLELENSLGFKFRDKNLLITYHPVTLENSSATQMAELLKSLKGFTDTGLIFTMPNADADGKIIFQMIEKFVAEHSNACAFTSLGHYRYLSCIAVVDAVVGNSSSGLGEAPSFKKATINIGSRQKGRLMADSVINCDPESSQITNAILESYSLDFKNKLAYVVNPYGDGGASDKIINILENIDYKSLIHKQFFDLSEYKS